MELLFMDVFETMNLTPRKISGKAIGEYLSTPYGAICLSQSIVDPFVSQHKKEDFLCPSV